MKDVHIVIIAEAAILAVIVGLLTYVALGPQEDDAYRRVQADKADAQLTAKLCAHRPVLCQEE